MSGWPLPRIVSHRGGGLLAPENTLAGLREAARRGCRAVEFDVMLSADGVPVLIHDDTLERTTDGHGRVCAATAAQLGRLDAGKGFDARFAGEPVPRFLDALDLCRRLGLAANVEIKPAGGHDVATGRLVAAMAAEHGAGVPMVLSSFSLEALAEAQRVAPRLPRGVLFGEPPADWLAVVRRFGALSMHCRWDALGEETLGAACAAHVPLAVYTCNEPAQAARLFDAGVASVITDRIDLFGCVAAGGAA